MSAARSWLRTWGPSVLLIVGFVVIVLGSKLSGWWGHAASPVGMSCAIAFAVLDIRRMRRRHKIDMADARESLATLKFYVAHVEAGGAGDPEVDEAIIAAREARERWS